MSYRDLLTLSSPVAISGISANHPIEDDQTSTIYSQEFIVDRASYSALSFSDTNATYASAYYIGDDGFKDIGDSIWRFTRRWANVPAGFNRYETVAFTYPAMASSLSGSSASITAISKSGSNIELTTTIAGVSSGDTVYVNVTFTQSSFTIQRNGWFKVVSTGTNIVRIAAAFFDSGSTFTSPSGTIQKGLLGRISPKTQVVTSRVAYEYLYTASPSTDLPPFQIFRPITATGEDATLLTGTTIPTASTYQAYLAAGTELNAECRVNRWNGNIYERVTRWIPPL